MKNILLSRRNDGKVQLVTIWVEKIEDGKAQFISTYEKNTPEDVVFAAETPDDACKFIFDEGAFAEFENPVSSVAAIFDGKWKIAGFNPE